MGSKRRSQSIALPWEQRGAWLRDLLAGPRWKVALLVVLLGVVGWSVWRASVREAQLRQTRAAIGEVRRALDAFRSEIGRCPRSIHELEDPPRPAHRYLREIPTDGWGRQLYVRCPGRNDPRGADVVSAGPSGDFFLDDNVM